MNLCEWLILAAADFMGPGAIHAPAYKSKKPRRNIRADVAGTPAPNQFDVTPTRKPPSAKGYNKPWTDEELEELRELMPDKERERRKLNERRIGKSGGLQSW